MTPRQQRAIARLADARGTDDHDAACWQAALAFQKIGHHVAYQMGLDSRHDADLRQEALIAMRHAAQKWDPHKGTSFATYARWWIRHYYSDYLRRDYDGPTFTHHGWDLRMSARRLIALAEQENVSWTVDDIAAILTTRTSTRGCTPETVRRALSMAPGILDVDATPDETTTPPDRAADQQRALALLAEQDARTVEIFARHYGIHGRTPETDTEIGRSLGMTRQGVNLIRHRTIAHLRARLTA